MLSRIGVLPSVFLKCSYVIVIGWSYDIKTGREYYRLTKILQRYCFRLLYEGCANDFLKFR